jgi:hypothetical protein
LSLFMGLFGPWNFHVSISRARWKSGHFEDELELSHSNKSAEGCTKIRKIKERRISKPVLCTWKCMVFSW